MKYEIKPYNFSIAFETAEQPKQANISRSVSSSITVAVAICTFHRPDDLQKAMISLKNQTQPPNEIIIVDNGCQKSIKNLVNSTLPDARYIEEKSPGLDFARNRAIMETKSQILAFLDDDCVADRYWVQYITETLISSEFVAMTGLILPLELITPAQNLFEKNGGFQRGVKQRIVPKQNIDALFYNFFIRVETLNIGSGCNMAFKTSILREQNGFDVALDTGNTLPGGGDLDMFYRVMQKGHKIVYQPRAVIRHRHRQSMKALLHQLTGHQRSVIAFLIKTFFKELPGRRLPVGLFLLWRLIKPIIRIVRRFVGKDVLPMSFLVKMLLSTFSGISSYYISVQRTQKFNVSN